ncbi:acetyl-CoA carboxylase carboxyltransferase subunit alpha [Clostridium sp. MSJ-4]|uniref:Acetyl-coenzyme A carboxylase carboxyl transferase subunit alpha n=1 Tax=Clostridium simiarum TaxID=2841506 RepID=A0ABS6F031_9CLOT|nr:MULTISPECIES: acetyl-CoA carboxylase carboxyltransferase subunit alpha [Clostridium]MBU5590947.1 acetyl-CoA carboxylase carboxyltransferase subunit alpha [Clostridium simiarum]
MSDINKAWNKVTLARLKDRPSSDFFIKNIFDDFIEFHGDRCFGDDKAIIGGIGRLKDKSFTIIAEVKGKDTKENLVRNFGMPHPEGYRKALRLMKQAEKFNRPIICFVDTPGAFCGVEAEERGQGHAIASNLLEMARLKVPILSVVIGEGGSGGALALAMADEVWMLENSIYSILSPEGFASILWKDVKKSKEAAEMMKLTSEDLLKFGVIDKIIEEPLEGLQKDPFSVASYMRHEIIDFIDRYEDIESNSLIYRRYNRYRNFGIYNE